VINVAAMVLLGRALGASGYGDYSFYYALIPLLSNLCRVRMGIVVTREIARDPACAPRCSATRSCSAPSCASLLFVGSLW
jgi:O-antigen/teichoic acid export membrane protein